MQFNETLTLPVSLEQMLAALADPTFQDLRAAELGAQRHTADITVGGGELYVGMRWEMGSEHLPPAARAMLGPVLVLHEVQRWQREDARAVGTLTGSLERVDLRLNATTELSPAGDGCTRTLTGELVSAVPLMGRQIEAAAAPILREALRTEAAAVAVWARSHP